jgi:hypothetical protein
MVNATRAAENDEVQGGSRSRARGKLGCGGTTTSGGSSAATPSDGWNSGLVWSWGFASKTERRRACPARRRFSFITRG